MRPEFIILVVLCPALIGTGCGNSAGTTTTAVQRVLKADEKLAQERKNLPPKLMPSQIAWSLGVYCEGLEQIDMSDCPADFRVAYKQHMRAWRDAQAAIKELPDDFLEGLFVGFFNGLLRGEMDGGTGRLEGDLKRAMERVRTSWEEVEKIGAKYGAAL